MEKSYPKAHRLDEVKMSPIRETLYKCAMLERQGHQLTKFTVGLPDFDTPEYVKEACKAALDKGLTKYADTKGVLELRQAISEKLMKDNGLEYSPEEIIVTSGVAQAMFVSMLAYLDPGDEIIVPNPVYNTYTSIPLIAGAVVKTYSLKEENDFQIDIDELASLITEKTKMIAIVSPNNPIGSVLTKENLEQVAELIRDTSIMVISDEIYERLSYDEDKPVVSIASIPGMRERTLVLNGVSKCFAMTGWRVGYVAAPKELLEPINVLSFYMTAGGVTFAQHAAAVAYKEEDGSLEAMRLEFLRRRNYIVEEINKLEHFSCLTPQGAFYVFMNIKKTGMSSKEFCDWMIDNYDCAFIPGSVFGSEGEGFVRLSYAASMETLEVAVKKLNDADKSLN